jgi:microcystin-dependent protein
MSEAFVGQIEIFAFDFAPQGWALCDGQLLLIAQNQSLASVLNNVYGGDNITTFGLPDFRGRLPMQTDTFNALGQPGGEDRVPLDASEMGAHGHSVKGSTNPAELGAAGKLLGLGSSMGRGSVIPYREPPGGSNLTPLASSTIGSPSTGPGHDNMQPSLVLNFCIALQGTFPT